MFEFISYFLTTSLLAAVAAVLPLAFMLLVLSLLWYALFRDTKYEHPSFLKTDEWLASGMNIAAILISAWFWIASFCCYLSDANTEGWSLVHTAYEVILVLSSAIYNSGLSFSILLGLGLWYAFNKANSVVKKIIDIKERLEKLQ